MIVAHLHNFREAHHDTAGRREGGRGSIQPFYSWGQQGEENVVLVSESVDGILRCHHLNGTS